MGCVKCNGLGGIDTWGRPCAAGTMHYKIPCTLCNGSGHSPPGNWVMCQQCEGKGGMNTFSKGVHRFDILYKSDCLQCHGKGYIRARHAQQQQQQHHQPQHGQHHHGGHHGGHGDAITYGSKVKLEHCETGCRLHSHQTRYPRGSRQQSVTCFSGSDGNDFFFFKPPYGSPKGEVGKDGQPVRNGDVVRLQHFSTQRNLHSHNTASHVAAGQHEVTCYETGSRGDGNDDWRVESQTPVLKRGQPFRLIHVNTNCALHSHNLKYRFINHNEVTCYQGRDNNDFWKVSQQEQRTGVDQIVAGVQILGNVASGLVSGFLGGGQRQPPRQQQAPPQPAYAQPQQPAYAPGYPQQPPPPAYAQPPPAAMYPPGPGAPPPQQYAPPPFQLPPAGAVVTITSIASGKNVRIKHNGELDGHGGNGQLAKFRVSPDGGYLRLQNVANPAHYLAIRDQKVTCGQGGQGCQLVVKPAQGGLVNIVHAHGHGSLQCDRNGQILHPKVVSTDYTFGQFRINNA